MRTRCLVSMWSLVAAAFCVPCAHASTFVLQANGDTIAVERFTNEAERAEGEIVFRAAGLRVRYTLEMAGARAFRRLEATVWKATDDTSAAPMQHVTFTRDGDSVLVRASAGAPQRIASPVDAIPYVNPSTGLMERIVQRAWIAPDSATVVPVLLTTGGQTISVRVTRIAADSVRVDIAGTILDLHVARDGRVLGGRAPSQGLTLVRADDTNDDALRVARTDYSAPRGAPYTAENVRIPTPGGFSLAGTLTRPLSAHGRRVPCVLTLSGSGPQDRDESIPLVGGYRPFRQIAEACATAGIAVLRFDDRGSGESGGVFAGSTTADFADDARAALAWARARSDIDGARVALLGHSEGALIAPMIAATDTAVRAIVLLAGPSRSGRSVMSAQNAWVIDHAGSPRTRETRDSLLAAAAANVDSAAASDAWVRYFRDYDPLPAARRVRASVLILHGATDRQVTVDHADELGAAFRDGGNRDVTVRVFPSRNHLFLRDANGDPAEYMHLADRAIAPDVLQAITAWLRVRLGVSGVAGRRGKR